MQRERVADDIYVFTSDLYAQVTAGVILTTEGAIVIDTLVYPEETLLIKRFVETRLSTNVRYVINTHFHADHTTGTCFFNGAKVISHALCRDLLNTRGRESIEKARSAFSEMRDVNLRLPDMVFDDGVMNLHVGNKTLQLWHTPGHSADSIVCLVKEDRVLFAADTVMPIPYFVGGDFDAFINSLNSLRQGNYENIIQGHGEVILRGEIEHKLQEDIDYLLNLQTAVNHALSSDNPDSALQAINVESCGKSRILLNGTVEQLHRGNVQALVARQRELLLTN
jgi:glyoxylase-like metal-dependent hydrolase (beta-lactamase superfamily II)